MEVVKYDILLQQWATRRVNISLLAPQDVCVFPEVWRVDLLRRSLSTHSSFLNAKWRFQNCRCRIWTSSARHGTLCPRCLMINGKLCRETFSPGSGACNWLRATKRMFSLFAARQPAQVLSLELCQQHCTPHDRFWASPPPPWPASWETTCVHFLLFCLWLRTTVNVHYHFCVIMQAFCPAGPPSVWIIGEAGVHVCIYLLIWSGRQIKCY